MDLIKWDSDLLTGVDKIDVQHKIMIRIINRFSRGILNKIEI